MRRHQVSATLAEVDDYWRSPAGTKHKWRLRWLETVRVIFEGEPQRKGRLGKRQAVPFRNAVRDALDHRPTWPRPRACLAVDFRFHASSRNPPSLWRMPKHYLDLLGATAAPEEDPGPVLFNDDGQVKLLFATLDRSDDGKVYLEARARASAIEDMQLAGELLDDHDELLDTTWAEADPSEPMGPDDFDEYLPADLVANQRFHDMSDRSPAPV